MINLVPAKCPSCGASLELDDNLKRTECKYCKTTIIVDDAIAKYKLEISGEVKVDGISGKEELLDNANAKFEMNNYNEALNDYWEYAKKYPRDYRGYYGIIKCNLERIKNDKSLKGLDKEVLIQNYLTYKMKEVENLFKVAPNDIKEEIKNLLEDFYHSHEKDYESPLHLIRYQVNEDNFNLTYKNRYQIGCDIVNLLNKYYFLDVFDLLGINRLSEEKHELAQIPHYLDIKYDKKTSSFELSSQIESAYTTTDIFGKNKYKNLYSIDNSIQTIYKDFVFWGIDLDGNLFFKADRLNTQEADDNYFYGRLFGVDISKYNIEELEKMLSSCEDKNIGKKNADKANKLLPSEFFKIVKYKYDSSIQYDKIKFLYIFSNGRIVFTNSNSTGVHYYQIILTKKDELLNFLKDN